MLSNKILLITPTLQCGGSEKLIVNLSNQLKKKQHKILIFKKKNFFFKNFLKNKKNVIFAKSNRVLLSFFELKTVKNKYKINVFFSSLRNINIYLGLIKKIFFPKIKLIIHEPNTLDEFKNHTFIKQFKLLAMRFAYKNASKVIANSEDTKKDLIKYKVKKAKDIVVIFNPIEVSNSEIDNLSKIIKFKKNKFTIIACGTLTQQKNFSLLIDAFIKFNIKFQNSCLIIVGEGDQKKLLNNIIIKNNLQEKVMLTGKIKNPYILFKKSNMFALSSKFEGFGNVIVEAMFAGLPIVSTNCPGGPKDILQNGKFGYLAKNKCVSSFYKQLVKCYQKPIKYNVSMIRKKYSSKNIVRKYLKVINL